MILAWQFQSPGPIIFEVGNFAIRWYGLLIASAVLIGVNLSQYLAKKREIDPELIADFAIWGVVAAIPCARIYYVLFQWQSYANRPEDIIAIWKGGIAIHGAILGGVLAGLIFSKLNRLSFWQLADLMTPALILGQAIGRWGNFFNSEAFGAPTDVPWKLYIPLENRPYAVANYEYFHPTFLYESLWNLGTLGILLYLFFWGISNGDRLKVGTIFLVYWIVYSSGRLWIEGLRMDSLMIGGIKMAQLVSFTGIALGLFGLFWLYILKKRLPDVVSAKSLKKNEKTSETNL
jgi:phosphatidylglycerol:prolipoprotein diacylglycerol transferase